MKLQKICVDVIATEQYFIVIARRISAVSAWSAKKQAQIWACFLSVKSILLQFFHS